MPIPILFGANFWIAPPCAGYRHSVEDFSTSYGSAQIDYTTGRYVGEVTLQPRHSTVRYPCVGEMTGGIVPGFSSHDALDPDPEDIAPRVDWYQSGYIGGFQFQSRDFIESLYGINGPTDSRLGFRYFWSSRPTPTTPPKDLVIVGNRLVTEELMSPLQGAPVKPAGFTGTIVGGYDGSWPIDSQCVSVHYAIKKDYDETVIRRTNYTYDANGFIESTTYSDYTYTSELSFSATLSGFDSAVRDSYGTLTPAGGSSTTSGVFGSSWNAAPEGNLNGNPIVPFSNATIRVVAGEWSGNARID